MTMGKLLTPAAMLSALIAFTVAALAAGLAVAHPALWEGAVRLAILGGIVPMIYAVNVRIVPVFSRRAWPAEGWLRAQIALAVLGGWGVFAGSAANLRGLAVAGSAAALAGGLLYVVNLRRLFRQPATLPPPPLPNTGQVEVDRLATRFMQIAGVYLLFGLVSGLALHFWRLGSGRWDLVWTHAMVIGFFLCMASGVCYHAVSRWSGRAWRHIGLIRLHLVLVALGLPAMLHALATNDLRMFAVAGPLQAVAIVLLLVNIAPLVPGLPQPTRAAFIGAALLLLVGVTLGSLFAIDPALGARLRLAHAEINLFGWTGLLISGAGYYLVPRFAGRPLRWPKLAPLQLGALASGVVLAVIALVWRAYGIGSPALLLLAQALIASGFALFAVLVAATMRPWSPPAGGTSAPLPLIRAPAAASPRPGSPGGPAVGPVPAPSRPGCR